MSASSVAPRGRRENSTRKGRSTFEHVRKTSVELFAEKGFAATSMRDLASRADLPLSAYYYYYRTKYDALLDIIEVGLADLQSKVHADYDPGASPSERLISLVAAHVAHHLASPQTAHVGDTEMRSLDEKDRRRAVQQRRAYEEPFRKALSDGVESGDFLADLDVSFTTNLILTMATGVIYWFKPGGKKSVTQAAEAVSQHALRMVR